MPGVVESTGHPPNAKTMKPTATITRIRRAGTAQLSTKVAAGGDRKPVYHGGRALDTTLRRPHTKREDCCPPTREEFLHAKIAFRVPARAFRTPAAAPGCAAELLGHEHDR